MYTRMSPPFCFNIPNPDIQIRQILHLEKPIGSLLAENEVIGFFLAFNLLRFVSVSTVEDH